MADPVKEVLDTIGRSESDAMLRLRAGITKNPDEAARNVKTARVLGTSPNAVATDPQTSQARARMVSQPTWAKGPFASQQDYWDWILKNPSNAEVSHDDEGILSTIGGAISAGWSSYRKWQDKHKGETVLDAAAKVPDRVGRKDFTFSRMVAKPLLAGAYTVAKGVSGLVEVGARMEEKYNPVAWGLKAAGLDWYGGLADFAERRNMEMRSDLNDYWRSYEKPFGRDIASGVSSIPGSLAALGVTIGGGGPVAGAAVLGAVTGGNSASDAMAEGASPEKALLKGAIDGGIETATEILPEKYLARLGIGIGDAPKDALTKFIFSELLGEQAATLGQDFNQWAMLDANKGKTFDEFTAEILPNAASTLTSTLVTSGALIGASQGFRYIDRVTGGQARRQAAAEEANSVAEMLGEFNKLATASKLRARDPASFHDFLSTVAEGQDVEDLYVMPSALEDVLNQDGLDPEVLTAATTLFGAKIAEAKTTGADVRIPLADFVTVFADTTAIDQLTDHVKVDPNGMTRADADAYMQSDGAQLMADIEQAVADRSKDDAFTSSMDTVKRSIEDQLQAVNRFVPKVNARYATLTSSFYATMGARLGMSAEELYQRYPLRIGAQGGSGELDQMEFTMSGDTHDTVILDADGNPRTLYHGTPYDFETFKTAGGAVWFAEDRKLAEQYADGRRVRRAGKGPIFNVKAFAKNPLYIDAKVANDRGHSGWAEDGAKWAMDAFGFDLKKYGWERVGSDYVHSVTRSAAFADAARAAGYDALAISEGGGMTWGMLYPESVYAADDGRLLFQGGDNGRSQQTGDGSGRDRSGALAPLAGAPEVQGGGPNAELASIAEAYARDADIAYTRQAEYVQIDPERGLRLAQAYEDMKHEPNAPEVRAAYEDLARQTRAQYDALAAAGYTFSFFDENSDPYEGNPWNAMRDLRENKHMAVFSTEAGFGSDEAFTPEENPLLDDTGLTWPFGSEQRRVLVNDLFRAVHDAFGHGLEGAGFRARGEENAWQAHARLFTGPALAALTTETRGQNSWLNFGPYGQSNKTAKVEDTYFADQKTGLLPEWAWTEGKAGEYRAPVDITSEAFKAWFGDSKVVDEQGKPLVVYHGTGNAFSSFQPGYNKDREGFYFTPSPDLAGYFAEDAADSISYLSSETAQGANIVPVFLSLRNPLDVRQGWPVGVVETLGVEFAYLSDLTPNGYWAALDGPEARAVVEALKGLGYDGLTAQEEGQQVFVAFDPEQIKSAVGNRGSFDPNDPSILNQEPVFFSALEKAVENMGFAKAPGQQWLATIQKTPGVKKEELEWTDLPEWLSEQTGPVTKDEVLAFVRAGGVEVEEVVLGADDGEVSDAARERAEEAARGEFYSNGYFEGSYYTIESENEDGETVWTVNGDSTEYDTEEEAQEAADEANSEDESEAAWDYASDNWEQFLEAGDNTDAKFEGYTEDGGRDYRELLLTLPPGMQGNPGEAFYESAHFGNHPVIAHVRFKSRKSLDGKNVMFIEEIQSDWHQKGRDNGYQTTIAAVRKSERATTFGEMKGIEADALKYGGFTDLPPETPVYWYTVGGTEMWSAGEPATDATISAWVSGSEGIPNAPFKTSWPALAMKRAIRWAVDNGFEQIAWTTGDQQRERYNLARSVGSITASVAEDGKYLVNNSSGNMARVILDRGLGEPDAVGKGALMTPEQITEVFGKDLGVRMVQAAENAQMTPEERSARFLASAEANKEYEDAQAAFQSAKSALRSAEDTLAKFTLEINAEDLEALARNRELYDEYKGRYTAARAKFDEAYIRRSEAKLAANDANARLASYATLDGEDLKIGGEGMLGFYNRNLVNITNDITKKFGAKVKLVPVEGMAEENPADPEEAARIDAELSRADTALRIFGLPAWVRYDGAPSEETIVRVMQEWKRAADEWRAEAEKYIGDKEFMLDRASTYDNTVAELDSRREEAVAALAEWQALEQAKRDLPMVSTGSNPGFDITPELAAAAQSGFALFQKSRGAYQPSSDTITLLAGADLSTFLHESGHFFLEMMHRLSMDPNAPADIKKDFDTLLNWFGVKDLATWDGMTLDQKRVHHEKFARGFEAYLFTGRAPAIRLRDIFRTFRDWLVAVYKSARKLDVTVSPQVRGVMDRMLATDEEIQNAEAARSMMPLFGSAEEGGMSPDQWAEYQKLGETATGEAISDLEARTLRDMKWLNNARSREINRLKREASATRSRVREAVAKEVMSEPVYRAMTYLKSGVIDGQKVEGPHKLYTPEIRAEYGEEAASLVEQLKGMTSTENGVNPQQIAELFGFSSVDHMLVELTSAEPMREKIDGQTEQRLLEEHGDLTDDKSIEEAADRAIHNEARAKFVAAELAALSKATGKHKILASAAKAYAAEAVARQRIRDLRPSMYEAAATRAARAAQEQIKKGNTLEAAAEKRNQLINLHTARAARQAREDAVKWTAYLGKFLRPATAKNIDADYLDQIHALLEAIDLKQRTNRDLDRTASYQAWYDAQIADGHEPVVDPDTLERFTRVNVRDMRLEELRGLVDAVKNIEHLGRYKNRLLTDKKNREFAQARDEAVDAIMGNAYKERKVPRERKGWIANAKKGALDFLAEHRKFASIMREMDGFRDGGTLWGLFTRTMNEAGDREALMRADATQQLAAILKPILGGDFNKSRYIPEINDSFTMEARIAIALNMGNSINKERVLSGENWTQAQVDAILAPLTAEHWQTVQNLWNFINSYWADVAAKQRRVTGVEPEKVKGEPLRVVTADGQTLDLEGGYYPIKYNAERNGKVEAYQAADMAQMALRGAFTSATTRRGHTKARVESTGKPLRYDLGVAFQHVTEVIHDLAWHEWLIDANKLLRSSAVDGAIREFYGPETATALRKTFEDIAAGDLPASNTFEKAIGHLRAGVTIAGMGWSLSTALLQPLGLTQSIVRIGPRWVGKGITRVFRDAASLTNTSAWVSEQSDFMKTRAMTQQREINEIRNKVAGKNSVLTAVEESFFVLIAKFQLIADIPTWVGQYEKSIDAGNTHEDAVALADQAVLDSQGGGQIKDLAQLQRGGPLMKLWTNFYSYFNVSYNLVAESINETRKVGPKRLPLLAVDYLLLTAVPATLAYLIRSTLRGDDKEPEELAADLAKENLSAMFGLMVGLREIGSIVQSDGRSQAPAGVVIKQIGDVYKQAAQGEADEGLFRAVNRAAGIIMHYPAGQVDRTVRGFDALMDGETSNPMALLLGPPQTGEKRVG